MVYLLSDSVDNGTLLEDVFLVKDSMALQDSSEVEKFDLPLEFPAFSIVKAAATTASADGNVAVSYEGWLEDD